MKSLVIASLATLTLSAAISSAALADPPKHRVPQPTSAACADAQQLARKTETGQPRIVYSGCTTPGGYFSRVTTQTMKAGAP